MSIEQVEQDIYNLYQHFHREAPGVWPREEGQLAHLWSTFDYLREQEHPAQGA